VHDDTGDGELRFRESLFQCFRGANPFRINTYYEALEDCMNLRTVSGTKQPRAS
jgi:hypothetical protein